MNTDVKNHSAAFGWIGILAVAAFCIMWLACFGADGSWVWGTNSISDFGVSVTDAANYFNYGCVITGVLLAVYGVGKCMCMKEVGYNFSGIMFILAGLSLVMVGVFTKDFHNGDYHAFFAVLCGIFFIAAIIAIAVQQYYNGMVLPVGVAIIVVIAVFAFLIQFAFAKFEVYAVVAGLIWIAMDASLMVLGGIKGGKKE